MPEALDVTTPAVLALFRPIHSKIREALDGLDPAGLNWRPGPETNSIGALVQHIAATEQGNIARITGATHGPPVWDETRRYDRSELLRMLDEADALLDEMGEAIPASSLAMEVTHPHRGPSTALVLLLQTYGHAYEHYGHLELTRQLYLQNFPPKQ
jgi:hypothetical protein